MSFFESMTGWKVLGLLLLAGGALVTFLSRKISIKMMGRHAELIVKCAGLAVVVAGFILIMFV